MIEMGLVMSDFTKEELELILHKFGMLTFIQFQGLGMLSMKINDMIEDYDAKAIESWHCEKCGHVQ